jgi:hypothetical protein
MKPSESGEPEPPDERVDTKGTQRNAPSDHKHTRLPVKPPTMPLYPAGTAGMIPFVFRRRH